MRIISFKLKIYKFEINKKFFEIFWFTEISFEYDFYLRFIDLKPYALSLTIPFT